MSVWTKWMRQPQTVWLRRALFQIHLWTGLALGLYLVMLSLTGSALVYRNELDAYFRTPRPAYDATAKRLTADELRAAVQRAYPDHTVTRVGDRFSRRNPTIEIWVELDDARKERLFDPYTPPWGKKPVTRVLVNVGDRSSMHDLDGAVALAPLEGRA